MQELETNTALPFPFSTAVSNCSTGRELFCNVDFVALEALIRSAFFEGALLALSSSREPRGVEERNVFDFVFVLGIACASELMASLAS